MAQHEQQSTRQFCHLLTQSTLRLLALLLFVLSTVFFAANFQVCNMYNQSTLSFQESHDGYNQQQMVDNLTQKIQRMDRSIQAAHAIAKARRNIPLLT